MPILRLRGADGQMHEVLALKGDKGDKGDSGVAGHTPVKGTDYFTETEKSQMVADVKDSLPTETWTFQLMNGSTVSKVVVMK